MKKREALDIVFAASERYKNELLNRDLLFLYLNNRNQIGMLETTFLATNFCHLTGLDTTRSKITAGAFFYRCLRKRLNENDIEFDNNGWAPAKLRVLQSVITNNLNAKMIGDYNQSQPKLVTEKLVGGQYHCIGFVNDEDTGRYVPNTLLECDIRQIAHKPCLQIVLTCRKYRNEEKYTEVVYSTKKEVNWDKIKTKLLDLGGRKDIIALLDKTIAFRSLHF